MIRIKTTGGATPNTTQWIKRGGRNVMNHAPTPAGAKEPDAGEESFSEKNYHEPTLPLHKKEKKTIPKQ